MHKAGKLAGFVHRCEQAGYNVKLVPVDDYGNVSIYFVPCGELLNTNAPTTKHIFEGRLYQFFPSSEGESEKKARLRIEQVAASLVNTSKL